MACCGTILVCPFTTFLKKTAKLSQKSTLSAIGLGSQFALEPEKSSIYINKKKP